MAMLHKAPGVLVREISRRPVLPAQPVHLISLPKRRKLKEMYGDQEHKLQDPAVLQENIDRLLGKVKKERIGEYIMHDALGGGTVIDEFDLYYKVLWDEAPPFMYNAGVNPCLILKSISTFAFRLERSSGVGSFGDLLNKYKKRRTADAIGTIRRFEHEERRDSRLLSEFVKLNDIMETIEEYMRDKRKRKKK